MTLPVWQGLAAREENTDITVLASPTVTVTNEATGGQPSLFSDRAGSNPLGNPFTANADGSIEFYVAPGRYGIEATKGGSTVTWENQLIGTMHGIDSPADGEFAEYDAGNDRWAARQAGYLNPEHATDSGNDAYVSATNTTPPAAGVTIVRDFQSANTTTTPTLDALTITTRDGSALWAGALSGVHNLQLNAGGTAWLVLDPNPLIPAGTQATSSNTANAIVQRDANGRAKFADPSAAQDAATKAYVDSEATGPALGTEVDATNGGANDLTEIDFTGIPAGTKRVTVEFDRVSLSGPNDIVIQIGSSSGVETANYNGTGLAVSSSGQAAVTFTSGFLLVVGDATAAINGAVVLTLMDNASNKWSAFGAVGLSAGTDSVKTTGGNTELSGELDRVRVASSGTDTFDNGNINIVTE